MKQTHFNPVFLIALVYCFACPFGNLLRVSERIGEYGASTLLLFAMACFGALSAPYVIPRVPAIGMIATLVAYLTVSSLLTPDYETYFWRSLGLLSYLLASVAAYQHITEEKAALKMLLAYSVGCLISSFLTTIDFKGIIDIPGFNERNIATKTDVGVVWQATGPFPSRSPMAGYFSMAISGSVAGFIVYRRSASIASTIFALAALSCTIALLLTHNRAGVIGAFAAVVIVTGILNRNVAQALSKSALAIGLLAVTLSIGYVFFPDTVLAYQSLFGFGEGGSSRTSVFESDNVRLELFLHSISSILENPLGFGYSMIHNFERERVWDPHSLLTVVVWGAGVFGIVWLLYSFVRVSAWAILLMQDSRLTSTQSAVVPLIAALLGYLIHGLFHATMAGIAWVFFGVLLSLRDQQSDCQLSSRQF